MAYVKVVPRRAVFIIRASYINIVETIAIHVGDSYTLVLMCTIGLAVSQPFLLNSWTTVPAKWFPTNQRATAVGIVTLGGLGVGEEPHSGGRQLQGMAADTG